MDKRLNIEELLAKAHQPDADALRLHPFAGNRKLHRMASSVIPTAR